MLKVVRAVQSQTGPHRRAAKVKAEPVVQAGVFEQQAVGGIVHQDGQAQLSAANEDDGQQKSEGVGPGYIERHGQKDGKPSMEHEVKAHAVGACAKCLVFFGCEPAFRSDIHGKPLIDIPRWEEC